MCPAKHGFVTNRNALMKKTCDVEAVAMSTTLGATKNGSKQVMSNIARSFELICAMVITGQQSNPLSQWSYTILQYITNWLVVWNIFYFSIQLGMSSSQLTNSYFSEGWRKTTNCRLDGHSSGIDRSIPHCLGISPHWIYFSPYRMGPAGPQSIAFSCLISGWILWFMLDIGTYKVISINHFYGYYRYRMI